MTVMPRSKVLYLLWDISKTMSWWCVDGSRFKPLAGMGITQRGVAYSQGWIWSRDSSNRTKYQTLFSEHASTDCFCFWFWLAPTRVLKLWMTSDKNANNYILRISAGKGGSKITGTFLFEINQHKSLWQWMFIHIPYTLRCHQMWTFPIMISISSGELSILSIACRVWHRTQHSTARRLLRLPLSRPRHRRSLDAASAREAGEVPRADLWRSGVFARSADLGIAVDHPTYES